MPTSQSKLNFIHYLKTLTYKRIAEMQTVDELPDIIDDNLKKLQDFDVAAIAMSSIFFKQLILYHVSYSMHTTCI